MEKMVYLKISEAVLIEHIGVNPIYESNGKYYVGLETLELAGEEAEHCIELDTLEKAKSIATEIKAKTKK